MGGAPSRSSTEAITVAMSVKPIRRPRNASTATSSAAFLLVPLLSVVLAGLWGLPDLPGSVWPALGRSVAVALGSAGLCIALALPIALRPGPLSTLAGLVPLSASALVVGTGLFIILRPVIPPGTLALPVTAVVNAGCPVFEYSPRQVKLALVGAGGRGTGAVADRLRVAKHIKLVAIADAVRDALREEEGWRPAHVEGYPRQEWILLDYDYFVVHVFTPATRAFYDLERLWGHATRLEVEA